MKRLLLFLAIAFQFVVLAYMGVKREFILLAGETVWLRTAPIDPRDIFRGDYVTLNYEISTIRQRQMSESLAERDVSKGEVVYVGLTAEAQGLATVGIASLRRPGSGRYIRGRVLRGWSANSRAGNVKYGIEKYFVEQGAGHGIEERRGTRAGIQVPMEMEVALGGDGTAVLKGYRWSALGMGLTMKRAGAQRDEQVPVSAVMALELRNVSTEPLALVMLPGLCSFSLESFEWSPVDIRLERPACAQLQPLDEHVIILHPDESRVYQIDFNEASWLVDSGTKKVSIGALDFSHRFRLVYRALPEDQIAGLRDGTKIWRGYLPSRAFHGRGRID